MVIQYLKENLKNNRYRIPVVNPKFLKIVKTTWAMMNERKHLESLYFFQNSGEMLENFNFHEVSKYISL